jgi:hypothetical protein
MDRTHDASAEPQLRAASYARLSETDDEAESVPTQLANADKHAQRRGWRVVARFKDDGYSAFKEISRRARSSGGGRQHSSNTQADCQRTRGDVPSGCGVRRDRSSAGDPAG